MCSIINDCKADNGETFQFSYSDGSYGFTAEGEFHPFDGGGTDVSDTTATAATVRTGYYFYTAEGVRTLGTYTGMDTSDATAYAGNIELGYTAYARGKKIVGTKIILNTDILKVSSVSALSIARSNLAATNIGNYALFGGGVKSNTYGERESERVDYYDTSLTSGVLTSLDRARGDLAAASNSNYALFAGGSYTYRSGDEYSSNNVDVYDSRLTRTVRNSTYDKTYLKGALASTLVFFAGGWRLNTPAGGNNYSLCIEYFNSSLSNSTANILGSTVSSSGSIGNYALFTGGTAVYAYNYNAVKSTPTALSESGSYLGSSNVNSYLLFVGGTVANAYNSSLTRTIFTRLYASRYVFGTKITNYAIFAGGSVNGAYDTTAEAYDNSLTKSIAKSLSVGRKSFASTSVGIYGLFGGGYSNGGYSGMVDAYYAS